VNRYGFSTRIYLLTPLFLFIFHSSTLSIPAQKEPTYLSKAYAAEYSKKIEQIEDFASNHEKGKTQNTRLTEEEINAYLDLNIKSDYKSCLERLHIAFNQDILDGYAKIDFTCVKEKSGDSLPVLMTRMFSGTHVLSIQGRIHSARGEGRFELEQARFDDIGLPGFLVEQAISSICRRQDPPFDPMDSYPLPYNIEKITIHPGYIQIFQQN
jgi:hypothetical protein